MAHRIVSVDAGSLAEEMGVCAGDELVAVNGETIVDLLDYEALCAESRVRLLLRRDGEETEYDVEKDEYEPLGLNFAQPLMSPTRLCCNRCLFCFVDQLPQNARPSLRVKDDDWRMSMMMGNYVTLTNVSDRELERIIRRHASPLYISVHAIDPQLRSHILGTPRGARLPGQLQKLAAGGIAFHTQAVLCPGLNDGAALEETIRTLARMYPAARSLALVPVGLTGHREGLCPLHKYTREEARAVLETAGRWRNRLLGELGTRFVFPSDEFYLAADMPLPEDEEYEDYGQIDDGVGMLRLLETEFAQAYAELPRAMQAPGGVTKVTLACGVSAGAFFAQMLARHPVAGVSVAVKPLENGFFGPSVTVSGLLTGGDLIRGLRGDESAAVLITVCMLRDGENVFLDDMTLEQVSRALGKPVIPVGRSGEELLQAIVEAGKWQGR
ncbi:MAG TPA: DUF512 domain-containing protein [Candidatus Pullichristensenella stercorigallinarum]|uniref:DUF512 domain-containing protein n=1 Tax=Candidatus Pullichristensenella stercorigallinarum TaxID=2840909 RepID=A0A9D0ZQG8_9FIRM|nr:DUF512 domain-containing protein [Candidatus Pullichristensenella stercorigallinarum]